MSVQKERKLSTWQQGLLAVGRVLDERPHLEGAEVEETSLVAEG
jgi:hypothetical protein